MAKHLRLPNESRAITADLGGPAAYEIGHGRPPVHSRFKPGQSGNPKGRPKGTRNVRTVVEQALTKRITIREGDRARAQQIRSLGADHAQQGTAGRRQNADRIVGLLRSFGMIGEEPEPTAPSRSQPMMTRSSPIFSAVRASTENSVAPENEIDGTPPSKGTKP